MKDRRPKVQKLVRTKSSASTRKLDDIEEVRFKNDFLRESLKKDLSKTTTIVKQGRPL